MLEEKNKIGSSPIPFAFAGVREETEMGYITPGHIPLLLQGKEE